MSKSTHVPIRLQLRRDHPIQFVLDWDGTLTKKDTIEYLVQGVIESKWDQSLLQPWEEIKAVYGREYQSCMEEHTRSAGSPTSVFGERSLLSAIGSVERDSVARVSQSGILKDLSEHAVPAISRRAIEERGVQFRNGWKDFFENLQSRWDRSALAHDSISVLSVNWSSTFIAQCLQLAGCPFPVTPLPLNSLTKADDDKLPLVVHILANEEDPSTGDLLSGPGIHSSSDKLDVLLRTRKISNCTLKTLPLVYVGDSWTDFECLLAADMGICIRDEPMTSTQQRLADSLQRVGIECPHIAERKQTREYDIIWARDFAEITEFLKNLPE